MNERNVNLNFYLSKSEIPIQWEIRILYEHS
jgi:hypothetical protein